MSFDNAQTFPLTGPNFQAAGNLNRFQGAFPDPYLDYASTQMPRSIYDVFRWCEFVWLTYGTYRMAAQRVVRYFLTSIELTDASDDEKEKYEEFLENQLRIMEALAQAGDNFMAYGNSLVSMNVPFRRYLQCPECTLEKPLKQWNWRWDDYKFLAKCQCGYDGEMKRRDRRSPESDPMKLIFWPPREIRITHHPLTGKTQYHWEIPGVIKDYIKKGNHFYLENTTWEVIEAIKKDTLFRFHEDVIYHLRDETISGLRTFGWGLPLIMSNFKQAWYIQVLKRLNEAIALDYIIPFRIITPVPGTGKDADPVLHQNLGNFSSACLSMFRQHRKDPTSIHTLPFPVELQMLGAEGKNLAPTDLIDKATDEFLNAQGVPAELYRGSLQYQAMPTALRLFERTWVHLVDGLNGLLNWIFKKVSEERSWENLKGRLQPVTIADDLDKKNMQLQLMASQTISKQTALAPFNINVREEVRRMLQEESFTQEETAKYQKEQQQRQQLQNTMEQGSMGAPMQQGMPGQPGMPMDPNAQGGGMPMGGGMGMPSGPSGGVTPEDLTMQAEQIAYQLLTMPYEQRRSQLLSIKKSNETLHSLVIAKMDSIRSQTNTQGGQMLRQQMAGAGAAQ